ncbi:MAG: DapH/DapD/GlmU-related protein [Lysobacteraceae bacterium]
MRDLVVRLSNAWHRLTLAALSLRLAPGVSLGRKVRCWGRPLVQAYNGGRVRVGDGVLLNSCNRGYHLNMFGPVKLLADRPGARIEIGDHTRIHGSCLHACASIVVGKRCLIAANCQLIDSSGHELCFPHVEERIKSTDTGRPIVLEDDVWLGAGTLVLPGVTIGRGSVVGAGSVVTRDIPPMVVAAGNPARVIRRFDER